jgi:AcrR family transcriptional regulator
MDAQSKRATQWEQGGGPGDLTARARIRNTALALFAERGFAGASLRTIADAAGVSMGLVQHHFGSKEALRQACDAYALEFIRREAEEGINGRRLADPDFISEAYRSAPPVMAYLARALTDDTSAAAAIFDEMVAVAEQHLSDSAALGAVPVRTLAAVLTAMKLGITVLHGQLSRALELDDATGAGWHEISRAVLTIVSPAITGSEIGTLASRGLDHYEETEGKKGHD